jgi:hypothetical protein
MDLADVHVGDVVFAPISDRRHDPGTAAASLQGRRGEIAMTWTIDNSLGIRANQIPMNWFLRRFLLKASMLTPPPTHARSRALSGA